MFCAALLMALGDSGVGVCADELAEPGSKPPFKSPAAQKEPAQKAELTDEQRQAKLEEFKRLWGAAQTTAKEGQYSIAAELSEQAAQIVRELVGDDHETNSSFCESISGWWQAAEEWVPARTAHVPAHRLAAIARLARVSSGVAV